MTALWYLEFLCLTLAGACLLTALLGLVQARSRRFDEWLERNWSADWRSW